MTADPREMIQPEPVRMASLTLIRNDADIVEAFVRHNCRSFDRMYIVDDHSDDATWEILNLLKQEGSSIEISRAQRHGGFYQGASTTSLMRSVAGQEWDFLTPLDADEFIDANDRASLEAELADVP